MQNGWRCWGEGIVTIEHCELRHICSTRLVIGSTLWSAHSSTNMKLLAALQMSPILASEICKNLRYWHTSFTFFFSFTKYLYCMYLILSQVYCWDCTSFCESSCCIQLFASNLSLDQVRIRVVRRWLVDIQQQLVELHQKKKIKIYSNIVCKVFKKTNTRKSQNLLLLY